MLMQLKVDFIVINKKHQLVISFDEYEVASVGVVEFSLPTEVIKDLLVSNTIVVCCYFL